MELVKNVLLPQLKGFWGEFLLTRFKGLRTDGALRCTDCKADTT